MFSDVVLSGSFTTPASGNANQTLQLPFVPDLVEIWVQGSSAGDNWTSTANPGPTKYAFWQKGMANGTALVTANTAGLATDTSVFLSIGGITPVTSNAVSYGANQGGSGITNAATAVMTLTASNVYNTGDIVIIEQTTAALQFSGIPWVVTNVTPTTYDLGLTGNFFNSSGFAATATNVNTKKVNFPFVFTPYVSYIVKLTTGSTTTVVTSYPHGLSVNDTVRLIIPSPWGTTQISGQAGLVTAVSTNGLQFTVAIDSSAASAFAFPTTAQAGAGVTWPQVVPFGDAASAFDLSATDVNYTGFTIGNSATAGAAILSENMALVLWRAQRSARVYTSLTS
jgi:hypothetical protein